MNEFVIIDLYSQREAVTEHLKGWAVSEILDWLQGIGTVMQAREGTAIYVFESQTGMRAAFCFTENHEFAVMNAGWINF